MQLDIDKNGLSELRDRIFEENEGFDGEYDYTVKDLEKTINEMFVKLQSHKLEFIEDKNIILVKEGEIVTVGYVDWY